MKPQTLRLLGRMCVVLGLIYIPVVPVLQYLTDPNGQFSLASIASSVTFGALLVYAGWRIGKKFKSNQDTTSGGQVGFRYSQLFGNRLSDQCGFGSEEYSENVICSAGVRSRISFIFEPMGTNSLPSIDKIQSAKVIEIYWNPHRANSR